MSNLLVIWKHKLQPQCLPLHFTKRLKGERQAMSSIGEDMDQLNLSKHCNWKHQLIQSLWKTLSYSLKQNTCKPYHLAVLLLAIYLTVICTQACVLGCSAMSHSLRLCSLPDSSVHGIFPARILEWVVISSSRGIFQTQGSNWHLLHWQAVSLPLSHLGSMFTKRQAALLALVKYRKHLQYPLMVEWINNDNTFIPWNTKDNENSTACTNTMLSNKS